MATTPLAHGMRTPGGLRIEENSPTDGELEGSQLLSQAQSQSGAEGSVVNLEGHSVPIPSSSPVFDIGPAPANTRPQRNAAPADAEAGTNGDNIVIVMVGLPARGKTFIGRRVVRYPRFFHGAEAEIFNAGNYRRKLFGAQQGHGFFDPENEEGAKRRQGAHMQR